MKNRIQDLRRERANTERDWRRAQEAIDEAERDVRDVRWRFRSQYGEGEGFRSRNFWLATMNRPSFWITFPLASVTVPQKVCRTTSLRKRFLGSRILSIVRR